MSILHRFRLWRAPFFYYLNIKLFIFQKVSFFCFKVKTSSTRTTAIIFFREWVEKTRELPVQRQSLSFSLLGYKMERVED